MNLILGYLLGLGLMVCLGLFALFLSYYPKILRKKGSPELIHKFVKRTRICGIGLIACGILLCFFFDWAAFRARLTVRQINHQIADVQLATKKIPLGDEQAIESIRGLKAIDISNAPADVKQAMNDYIGSFEQALEASKNHQDPTPFTQACRQNGQILAEVIRRYK